MLLRQFAPSFLLLVLISHDTRSVVCRSALSSPHLRSCKTCPHHTPLSFFLNLFFIFYFLFLWPPLVAVQKPHSMQNLIVYTCFTVVCGSCTAPRYLSELLHFNSSCVSPSLSLCLCVCVSCSAADTGMFRVPRMSRCIGSWWGGVGGWGITFIQLITSDLSPRTPHSSWRRKKL